MQHKEPQRQSVAPEGWPQGPGRGVLVREPTRGTEGALAAARRARHWSLREGGEEVATAPCGNGRRAGRFGQERAAGATAVSGPMSCEFGQPRACSAPSPLTLSWRQKREMMELG